MVERRQDVTSRWRRRKEARPSEILSAALECFAERGFAATRLDDVARRAGVTKGTLYLYFPSKEELFKSVVGSTLVPNIERGEVLASAGEPAPVALDRLLQGWAELARSPAGAIPKIIISEAGNFPDLASFYREQVVERGLALFRRVVTAGIDRGEFRPVDIDITVRCLVAPLLLAMLWRHSLGREETDSFEPEALCRTHLELMLDGLVLRPSATPIDPSGGSGEAGEPIP